MRFPKFLFETSITTLEVGDPTIYYLLPIFSFMMIESKLAKHNILAGKKKHVHDMIRTVLLKSVLLTCNRQNNATQLVSFLIGKMKKIVS